MRRAPCYATRPLPLIERVEWRIRTLHPFRPLVLVDGQRPPLPLDRVEEVTVARVHWIEGERVGEVERTAAKASGSQEELSPLFGGVGEVVE